ncbi:desmoplakin isoform X1 [Anguilla anguilla]|uniref:desmoplakin isoform X1 n=1 Tax=Anguilla anguilla TaxID=7936 RepID=UPI0015B1AD6F|nr:desmoplakin isoform X1 [Anguilla anguilla]
MSTYGSQTRLPTMSRRTNSRPDLSSPSFTYSRTEGNAGGNGFYPEMMDGSNTIYYTKTISGGHGGGHGGVQSIHQKAQFLQSQFKEYLNKAEFSLQSGGAADADRFLEMSSVVLEQLQGCGIQLEQMGQPSDSIMRNVDQCRDQLRVIHFSMNGQAPPQRKNRGGSIGHDGGRAFHEAMAWIAQQKRLVETAPWGDDQATIEQQITKHSKFHSAIQRSPEVERARIELEQKGERSFRHALDQEWDSLQKMSCSRSNQLRDLSKIIEDISREIIWVNEREEEELVFDWGDKDIDNYIPKKQESYSRLMRDLEEKEKDLNKLNQKVENLMKNNHPASDKIEAYKDTLQTQWSWLLQITKCIDTHLKENAAYSQFFKEANETYGKLQKEHENIRKKFTCDKGTSLEMLMELIKNLQKEKEVIMENKRQVQHLVNKSKSIVRLKPRNTHEKSGSPVIVKALCDFKQDQKQILKGNEAILKDNTQRSKWHVTGPGGLDMLIPSVCLLVPPPNPLSISLANKNEQYFEAIMGIWNQLFINIKSLISWRYCLQDIERINSLTITMLAKMRPDEYRKILKSLETRYQEFMRSCVGSEMFADEDKVQMERQYTGAQDHYDKLVVQLPTYNSAGQQVQVETIQRPTQTVLVSTQPPRPVSSVLISSKTTTTNVSQSPTSPPPNKGSSTPVPSPTPSSSQSLQSLTLLSELHALRQKLELAESGLTQHIHVPLGENSVHECSQRMLSLEQIHQNIDSIRDEHVRLREKILIQLEGMKDMDKAKFLRTELNLINQKIGSLEGFSTNYIQRLKSLQALQQSLLQAEDIIKVHEARLTEKETSSLEPRELEDYRAVLKRMKQDLDQKRDVLKKLEMELGNTEHWNNQISQSFHKCDVDLSRYREQVTQMIDRWRRMQTQIDTRMWDLEKQQQQLKNYKQTSSQVNSWIGDVQQRQDSLLSKKFNDLKTLTEHLNQQKMLYSEIKGKKDKVDDVVRDAHTCASSIADYEVELASYSAGLETLLNIPIKRTMLQSPTAIVREEAIDIQSRYIELFTRSGDYYKFLGDLQKNMEELKMSNTRIELLEEELRRLKEEAQDRAQKNRSLEDSLSRYQLELSQSKDQLLSMEEVKRTQALQCSAAKDNLDSTYSQVKDLDDKVTRLTYALDEEKRKRRLAEERYTNQQDEYDLIVRKRQKELDDVSRSKLEIEKTIKEKEREIERLRMQLEDEEARRRTSESELSKVRNQYSQEINNIKQTYESEIHVTKVNIQKLSQKKDEDSVGLRMEYERLLKEKSELEEELRKIRLSLSQAEEMRRKAEEEVRERKTVGTEEGRKRRELEIQIETFIRQREESELWLKEAQGNASKATQEKDKEITRLMQEVEEERRRRRALETENGGLRNVQAELQAKHTSSMEVVSRIKASEEEMGQVKVELEREKADRAKCEQHISRLEIRIKDLQRQTGELEAEAQRQREAAQSEAARRKKVETDLERSTLVCKEHITTITLLKKEKEDVSSTGQQAKQELRSLHESLDKTMRDYKAATEKLDKLTAELKALHQQLNQEQARVREANLRNETLYKTIEEKSKVLNDNSSEIQKLQAMTQSLTKERLRLEEELRVLRQERDELKKGKESIDSQTSTHISSLEVQLQTSSKKALEFQSLINDLSRERDKLRAEIEKIRKQAAESSGLMHESQTRYKDLLQEKETLLLRIKTVEQEKGRAQKNEDELSRIRLSLESEMRQKQHLQDELDQLRKDFNYWKSQYELKDGLLRQCDTDKGKAERELSSLRSEIERLAAELRAVEERYKGRLQSSEREVSELTRIREDLERQLQQLRMRLVELESRTVVDHSATITSAVPSKSVSNTTTTTTTVTTKKTSGKDMKVPGIRGEVTITELVESNLLDDSDVRKIEEGLLTSEDIENKLKTYLHGSDCIAGIFDEKKNRTLPIYQAMKEGLLRPGTTLELLEAQAASGFMIDPINNLLLTVEEAWKRNLIGREFKAKLMSAERAVTGYNDPRTGKIISLFQAMEKGIIEKGHGIRLLEAQIASGGIIDPKESHRIDVDVAYRRGYFDEEMNEILSYEGDDTKGFFDPNTEENLTYLQLKERCITDEKTGLVLLPLWDKSKSRQQGKSSQKNTLRKRRVVIVDPDTQKEMTVREAYHRELIDYDTFLELSEQECEWEEITITAPDGSTRLVVVDRKTGKQYDIQDYLDRGLLSQKSVDQYRSGALTLTEFADQILNKSNMELSITSTSAEDVATCSSPTQLRPSSPTARKRFSSISITLSPASEILDDLSPIAAIFDTETVEKITIPEAHRRGIVDTITAQRLLEAQACTGGIINPGNGQRLTLQDAVHQGIIDEDMAAKLKPAQKAFQGFEDVKTKRKMSAAEAMKEKWLPHEAGQRFLEFQYLTGGLIEPGTGQKVSIEEAIKRNWLEGREARKLQDTRLYIKNLTCPKTKLKISYKEALDNCMVEENNGMKMIQATSISSKGISSPYNVRSNSGSRSGSRAGSRTGSRRGSVDLTTSSAFSFSSSSFSSSAFS